MAYVYIVRAKTSERDTATAFILKETAEVEALAIITDWITKHNDVILNGDKAWRKDWYVSIPEKASRWRWGLTALQKAQIEMQGLPIEDAWNAEELAEGSNTKLEIEQVALRFAHEYEGANMNAMERAEERIRALSGTKLDGKGLERERELHEIMKGAETRFRNTDLPPDVKSVKIAMEANVPKPRWAITYNGLAMENISTGDILQFDAETGCVRRMLFGEAR